MIPLTRGADRAANAGHPGVPGGPIHHHSPDPGILQILLDGIKRRFYFVTFSEATPFCYRILRETTASYTQSHFTWMGRYVRSVPGTPGTGLQDPGGRQFLRER